MVHIAQPPHKPQSTFSKVVRFATLLATAAFTAERTNAEMLNDCTATNLWATPVDQMRYQNVADSTLSAQRVVGNGEVLKTVIGIFSQGTTNGVLNGGSFNDLEWEIRAGSVSSCNPTNVDFPSTLIATLPAPSNTNWPSTKVTKYGLDWYRVELNVEDRHFQLPLGQTNLVMICPHNKNDDLRTIALGLYARPATTNYLSDCRYTPYEGFFYVDNPTNMTGAKKIAQATETVPHVTMSITSNHNGSNTVSWTPPIANQTLYSSDNAGGPYTNAVPNSSGYGQTNVTVDATEARKFFQLRRTQ